MALVFGSVARGEETATSDIDLLILGDVTLAEAVHALHPLQATLGREINPVVYRPRDFIDKLAAGNTWAREVVARPKLFLVGTAGDFADLNMSKKSQNIDINAHHVDAIDISLESCR